MDWMGFAASAIFGVREVIAILNTNTGEAVFMKHENPAVPLNQTVCFTDYVRLYLEKCWVHPDDAPLFDCLLNLEELRGHCSKRENGVLMTYRKLRDGRICWARILLNVPTDYSAEKPEVLLCLRYLSEQEADTHDAFRTMGDTIRKVVKCDFRRNTLRQLKLPKGEDNLRARYRPDGIDIAYWMDEEPFVHPDDAEEFRRGTDRQKLLEWFSAGNLEKNVFYRRKMGGLYRWVKLIIQPASDYTPEHPVFLFYIVDVHRTFTTLNTSPIRSEPVRESGGQGMERETFYDNMMNALSFFTQHYKDFYIVDLNRDQYIKYKVDRALINGSVPYVGCYSELAAQSQAENYFASLEELRMILEDKVSFEYTFTAPDGRRYRTIYTRIESEGGVPTKLIVRTVPEKRDDLLKVKTFGSFEVYDRQGKPISFTKKKSKQLLAYLIDKYGFPSATVDIVQDVLEKDADDLNAKKYVSNLFRMAVKDLEAAGYTGIICKEWNSLRVDVDRLDCDYYHLIEGDASYWAEYHNEYMKEYSWAEERNAEILHYGGI